VRFGSLVHAVLAQVDLDADAAAVRAAALSFARMLGASAAESAAAATTVQAALQHPLLRRAARSEDVRREVPVVVRLGGNELLEGVVDLAFREENDGEPCWIVVDFKTDREIGDELPRYERQVALYAQSVAAATGEAVRAALLVV
jgi:ATP-dependent exoDNAse (exonuclease V) beta subunit